MDEDQDKKPSIPTLEHTDKAESLKQLWWTIGVTVVALAVMAFFFF